MKLRIGLFATLLIISFSSFSQGLDIGVKAGSDIHKIDGKSFDEEFKFGYHIGAFAEIKLKKIGIQPEVYFSQVNVQRGNDVNSIWNTQQIKEAKLSYLNIPLLVNLKFSENIAFQVGPQYSMLVNESNKSDFIGTAKETFKSGDFSAVGGLQVKILKIRIFGRYVVGLNNMNDLTSEEKWKSRTIHVGVGYSFL